MLSPQVQERITTPANTVYCDCKINCVDRCKLPPEIAEMLMSGDQTIMLLVGGHKSDRAGDIVKRGKGWKVCRVK